MTKKYFVSVAKRLERSGFVGPLRKDGALTFVSIKTGKPVEKFMTVYTGTELSPNDVFARMVDSGLVFESVEQTLSDLEMMLKQAKDCKMGHIYTQDLNAPEFTFQCVGKG